MPFLAYVGGVDARLDTNIIEALLYICIHKQKVVQKKFPCVIRPVSNIENRVQVWIKFNKRSVRDNFVELHKCLAFPFVKTSPKQRLSAFTTKRGSRQVKLIPNMTEDFPWDIADCLKKVHMRNRRMATIMFYSEDIDVTSFNLMKKTHFFELGFGKRMVNSLMALQKPHKR
jgi:hypothetical protein